jgi:hypothetical protein
MVGLGDARAGTSTSSIKWPRNVALARISTSRNDDDDCSGRPFSLSSRCRRQGEWTSSVGTPNTPRQAIPLSQRPARPMNRPGRRPTTWSHWLIAESSGSRCSAVQGWRPCVTRSRGADTPIRLPSSRLESLPAAPSRTTVSTSRPRARSSSASDRATAAERSRSPTSMTTIQTAASVRGSRRNWASNGSSYASSDVAIRPPLAPRGRIRSSPTRASARPSSGKPPATHA